MAGKMSVSQAPCATREGVWDTGGELGGGLARRKRLKQAGEKERERKPSILQRRSAGGMHTGIASH